MNIRIVDGRQSRNPPVWKSFGRAIIGAAVLFVPGVITGSAAMQWAGFIILLVLVFLVVVGSTFDTMTITEARKKLDELEAK